MELLQSSTPQLFELYLLNNTIVLSITLEVVSLSHSCIVELETNMSVTDYLSFIVTHVLCK